MTAGLTKRLSRGALLYRNHRFSMLRLEEYVGDCGLHFSSRAAKYSMWALLGVRMVFFMATRPVLDDFNFQPAPDSRIVIALAA